MKKISYLLMLSLSISINLLAQSGLLSSNSSGNQSGKAIFNGVWEWDAAAMGSTPMLAKFLTISDQNGNSNNGVIKVTMTPDNVKQSYANWIVGSNQPTALTWWSSNKYYTVEVGGITVRNSKKELIGYTKYELAIFRDNKLPNYLLEGVLIETSWSKPRNTNIQVQPVTKVLQTGLWFNKQLKEQAATTVYNINYDSIVNIIKNGFKPIQSITSSAIKLPDFPPGNIFWKPNFIIKDVEFETLTVDSEKNKNNQGINSLFQNKAEYRGSFEIGLFANVNNRDMLRWTTQKVFDFTIAKPNNRYLLIGLNEIKPSLENYSKGFVVSKNEFNNIKLRVFGILNEIDGPFEFDGEGANRQIEPATVLLNNSGNNQVFKEVLLKDLHFGDNVVDISQNGKTFRLHFTIE
ncbi:MAG: hypothetical protein ACOVQE_08470 [Chitinophagaceae bacterium]